MGKRKGTDSVPRTKPATSPEGREDQLIALAYNLAEKRLREGTASSQEIVHFLKMGSTKGRNENEILEKQKELITAKTESLKSAKKLEELYGEALKAMRDYSGDGSEDDVDD